MNPDTSFAEFLHEAAWQVDDDTEQAICAFRRDARAIASMPAWALVCHRAIIEDVRELMSDALAKLERSRPCQN
jgi:hypothetical protein